MGRLCVFWVHGAMLLSLSAPSPFAAQHLQGGYLWVLGQNINIGLLMVPSSQAQVCTQAVCFQHLISLLWTTVVGVSDFRPWVSVDTVLCSAIERSWKGRGCPGLTVLC